MTVPVAWNEWTFSYEVKDKAGLGLRDVHYKGVKFLHKASLPVIRVKYEDDDCGPYQDRNQVGKLGKVY